MLTTRWRTAADGSDGHAPTCTVLASRLALRSPRDVGLLVRRLVPVQRALRRAPGLAGHALAVEPSGVALWTVSAWHGRADLGRFDRCAAHERAKRDLGPRLRSSTLAVWTCPAADLPVGWPEVVRRVRAAAR